MNLTQVSKYMSLILRHKPEEIGITLDKHGWANTSELIEGIKKKYPYFCYVHLEQISFLSVQFSAVARFLTYGSKTKLKERSVRTSLKFLKYFV